MHCRAPRRGAPTTLDGDTDHAGPLDVLCQHILNPAAAAGLFRGGRAVRRGGAALALMPPWTRETFDRCLEFAARNGAANAAQGL